MIAEAINKGTIHLGIVVYFNGLNIVQKQSDNFKFMLKFSLQNEIKFCVHNRLQNK